MIYEPSAMAVTIFFAFVAVTLGISFYLGRKAKSSEGYFAAHGEIPWFVNGVAFAGDYLSAASFLGICGMIAFFGYDGFLYSIGFLAGWIVALFVVAEPIKRMGKFTFADALDAKFGSRGIKFAAGISTLVVSVFYLIPQMVGAGSLIKPLLGFPHWVGVLLVGATVVTIVVTAGMVSTTYVQFLKGSLLVIFSLVLTVMILSRGFQVESGGADGYELVKLGPWQRAELDQRLAEALPDWSFQPATAPWDAAPQYVRLEHRETKLPMVLRIDSLDSDGQASSSGSVVLREAQTRTITADGAELVNGQPLGTKAGEPQLHPVGHVSRLPGEAQSTGALGPLSFFRTLQESEVVLWRNERLTHDDGAVTTVYYQKLTPGAHVLRPGEHPRFRGIRSGRILDKLNFLSLMLALFCGTASLPHILIRYYTVRDELSARRSTIVGIGTIGFFYVLTLYLGIGAMTSGALDVTDSNMAAPLLAKSMNEWLFAIISAIAFTTVLGTVSGLILASSGAVTHDLLINTMGMKLSDAEQVRVAKVISVIVGAVAIVLGILFQNMNVGFLVGWAFSVAASANLPALIMLLFWKRTTSQGVIAGIVVGMISSLAWILSSADTFKSVYGLPEEGAWVPFGQPGIVTIPLGFATLIVVSLLTQSSASRST